jgi:dihydroorotate dehydrogenase
MILNAVGLSGPGAKALLKKGPWQQRTEPFFISFMSVAKTEEERMSELKEFTGLLAGYLPLFDAPVGLQINYSCPNVGLDPDQLICEVKQGLEIASQLGIPLMPKFNVLAPPRAVREITRIWDCDAICISNTIPWGQLPDQINWKKLFGSDESPLAQFGGGGLSGKPLLALVAEWVAQARNAGVRKPINAGGGILSLDDLGILFHMGASSVFIGSVATLRPWRVKKIIKRAHQLFN